MKKARPRRAQLVADAVSVLCPYCGEPQPNPKDGSEQWEKIHFTMVAGAPRDCVSCDEPIFIFNDTKVQFP